MAVQNSKAVGGTQANGFALSPIAPLSWAAVVGLSN
jgi:hypothetical protein